MSNAIISASLPPSPAAPPAASRPGDAAGKKSFATLLAKANSGKEQNGHRKGKPDAASLSDATLLTVPVALLQSDSRTLRLSLPPTSEEPAGSISGASPSAPDNEQQPRGNAAGKVAFGVNITKSLPGASTQPVATEPQKRAPQDQPFESANHGSDRDAGDGQPDSPTPAPRPAAHLLEASASHSATAFPSAPSPLTASFAPGPHPAAAQFAHASDKPAAATSATAAREVAEANLLPAPKAQNLDFRVAGTDNREVNVRVAQRAGELQVTVRTGDSGLAESLRAHLPELSDRLTQSGVAGEIWRPSTTDRGESDTGPHSDAGRDPQASGEASGQSDKNNSHDQQQDAWLKELFGAQKHN